MRDVPWLALGVLPAIPLGRWVGPRLGEGLVMRLLAAGLIAVAARTAVSTVSANVQAPSASGSKLVVEPIPLRRATRRTARAPAKGAPGDDPNIEFRPLHQESS